MAAAHSPVEGLLSVPTAELSSPRHPVLISWYHIISPSPETICVIQWIHPGGSVSLIEFSIQAGPLCLTSTPSRSLSVSNSTHPQEAQSIPNVRAVVARWLGLPSSGPASRKAASPLQCGHQSDLYPQQWTVVNSPTLPPLEVALLASVADTNHTPTPEQGRKMTGPVSAPKHPKKQANRLLSIAGHLIANC